MEAQDGAKSKTEKAETSRAKSGPGARGSIDYEEEQDRDHEKHKDRTKPQEQT